MCKIKICGARTHNLKNINLIIPRNKLIVITGLSGSGKSSLAFNTLYAEIQRHYFKFLSTYAKQFLSLMDKPDVDYIEGISPAISIEQKSLTHNPRSTVGTITEIYDYLRLLFAKVGEPYCPHHNVSLTAQNISQMVDFILSQYQGKRLILLAPLIKECKGKHNETLKNLIKQGYIRVRINRKIYNLSDLPKLESQTKYTIEAVVDRLKVSIDISQRLAESFETALNLSNGTAMVVEDINDKNTKELFFSANFNCPICGYTIPKLEPHFFSFNNPAGYCSACNGLGVQKYFDSKKILRDQHLSIAEGAIPGWDKRNFHHFQIMLSLSKHYKFNIDESFNKLNHEIQKKILFGSKKEKIKFKYINKLGKILVSYHSFEGIIPNIKRQYKKTKSASVHGKLYKYMSSRLCTKCSGTRLRNEVNHVFLENITLPEIFEMSVESATLFFDKIKLKNKSTKIAEQLLKEIQNRLKFLSSIGLNYISLSRPAETLSSGEIQRIHLANHINTSFIGVIYILDEPSIGLHKRDNKILLKILKQIRDLGNTVIMVEHDEDAIRAADYIIDLGPGAGLHGGQVIAEGTIDEIMANPLSLTGQFLSRKKEIAIPQTRIQANPTKILKLVGARGNNLKEVNLMLPVGLFTCITGVSGSGKSTLINNTLGQIAKHRLNGITKIDIAPYCDIQGLNHFDKVININQSPIGSTPRSNPCTYIGIFTEIRKLFINTPKSRARGYTLSRFSFNLRGGRCEACHGDGIIKVYMHFLPNVYVPCDYCKGQRYNRETLEIKYKGKNIHEILKMSIQDAYAFFKVIPTIAYKLQILIDVGLSYICLGQSSTTLSAGESQRIKLARELSKRNTGRTLYILDEPTTGLHFADIKKLLVVLHKLRDQGNTIIVIEHNLDVIKTSDWIIDLGLEGGKDGGKILFAGTPEKIVSCTESHTAHFLRPIISPALKKNINI